MKSGSIVGAPWHVRQTAPAKGLAAGESFLKLLRSAPVTSNTSPESAPFAHRYAQLSEQELLALAREYDSLVEPAQSAMRAEFAKRKLEPPLVDEDLVDTAQRLVTVRRYRDLSEAIVARSMLEAAEIDVHLQDENLVRLDWQVSNFIGGIRLQVPEDQANAATELLDQPVPVYDEIPGQPDFEQPTCPHCHSTNVTFTGADRRAAIASTFAFGVPLPLGAESWLCNVCDTRWQDTSED
jgi:hypothetical protein